MTFSHTNRADLRKPIEYSRAQFADLLVTIHEEVFNGTDNKVNEVMVFREKHADGNIHIYAIVGADKQYGFVRVWKKLQDAHKVFCSYGSSHVYFWSAVAYGSVPTVHKAKEEMDPEPYNSVGFTLREKLADMPRGARKADKDRVRAFLGIPDAGGNVCAPTYNKEERRM